jgi:amidase
VPDDLAGRCAGELAALVRAKEASAREVVQALLDRIDAVNGELNAIVTLVDERALTEADAIDRLGASDDHDVLSLAGVPFTVKDVIATAGVRTTAGSPTLKDWIPRSDATGVRRLRDAGAILIGKTNCPEWAMFPYTRNSLFGETKNPRGPVTVGGSSGGEAAAVASGCSALGVGTDFGGSLRWPAHCTGLFALRPTAGRVPGTGQLPTPSLDEPLIPNEVTLQGRMQVIGPLAHSIDDIDLATRVMAGPDGRDPFAVPAPFMSLGSTTVRGAILWEGPSEPAISEDVKSVVRQAADSLADRDVPVEDMKTAPMLERAVTLYSELRDTDRLQDVRRLTQGRRDELGDDVRAAIAAAEESERREPNPGQALLWEERDRLRAAFLDFLGAERVLLMAVATVAPYALDGPAPVVGGGEQSMWDVLAPSRLISLFGLPAASVPFGSNPDGLPIGVQVVGPPFREDLVLAAARVLMEERRLEPNA